MTEDVLITCTKCNAVLDRVRAGGVDVDVCKDCGGLWLDRGELVKLKLGADKAAILKLELETRGKRAVPPSSHLVRLPCPKCDGRLEAFAVGDVDLDACDSCNGLWLDRGELRIALDALTAAANSPILDKLIGTT